MSHLIQADFKPKQIDEPTFDILFGSPPTFLDEEIPTTNPVATSKIWINPKYANKRRDSFSSEETMNIQVPAKKQKAN